ncbi:MAG: hypothetical protein DRH20_14325 [Deltaproteobacteria bacterium]|nr:MAG: hypothetical protein DRH20_14325 [Deltaproteobacteria bacterium]
MTPMPPRDVDRFGAFVVYVGIGVLTLWAGSALLDRALYSKFYRDYLVPWRAVLVKYESEGGRIPPFSGTDHSAYMERLEQMMKERGMGVPRSNTEIPFIYRLRRLWSPNEDVFLLWYEHSLVLYGISRKTFERLDRDIDGRVDARRGRLTGRSTGVGRGYIARWTM